VKREGRKGGRRGREKYFQLQTNVSKLYTARIHVGEGMGKRHFDESVSPRSEKPGVSIINQR
jgi:hypothetical protein